MRLFSRLRYLVIDRRSGYGHSFGADYCVFGAQMNSDIVNGIGVYLTELGSLPVLVTKDHEVVFLTPCNTYGWTRDGKANGPKTRADHGNIWVKLFELKEPQP